MAIPLERLEGKYEILEKLREGGMGAIYKVRHRLLGEVRMIKVMRPQPQDRGDGQERFLAEARAAIRLPHSHPTRIFDCSLDEDGNAYIEMEYVPGVNLAELLARPEALPLPAQEAVSEIEGSAGAQPDATPAEDQETRILRSEPDGVRENTTLLHTPPAPAAGAEALEKTLGSIRALRDEGRAGEALTQLNLAWREYGDQPALKTLRWELSEALLARDAEEETASRMFEAFGEPAAPDAAASAPRPSADGLHDATIRSTSAVPPRPERPGPPGAQSHRGMLAVALVLAVVFALLVWVLTRQGPPAGAGDAAAADGGAAGLAPGSVAIDAAPWAEIAGLEQPGADEAPIPPSRFTPVILQLPPGGYVVTLRYPPTGEEQTLTIRVESGVRVDRRVTFRLDVTSPDGAPLDGRQYFGRVGW